ncbi:DcaP family trimeric outer membrane transporter [Eudoraea chungangensis]|uniref:DcaP family trimeric outer membrane transporter n=1 Tax=Eudoraea chungangensis TaxID=1481905 RepID=UPI0023EDD0EF|nr:DcaP family trimeric outer membrane transporter [Eudoraea chungangensis]
MIDLKKTSGTVCTLILLCHLANSQELSNPNDAIASDTIQQGLQGSPNPMNSNRPIYTGEELLDQTFPNSIPIFGSGVRLRIGGYVKADMIHDFDYIGDPFEFELGSIAVEGSPERELGGTTTFHAKETRINFDFRSKAKWKNGKEFPVKIYLELDWFFDDPSSRLNTRLRQAYGVVGRLLVGRTWTTSGDLSAIPSLIDFAGGDALYGGRVTQIRWQDTFADKWSYAVALEDPAGQIDNPDNIEGQFRPQYPNLAGNIRYKSNNGSTIQVGADLFGLTWRGPETSPNVTTVAYALTVMSRIIVVGKHYRDAFTWGGGIGKGQAHRIIALSWDGKASGVVDENGLDAAPAWFAYTGYNHYWTEKLNSNIAAYWAGTTLSDIQTDDTIANAGSAHLNLVYFPYKKISCGVEYMYGLRENKNGVEGKAGRIQFMAKFMFN